MFDPMEWFMEFDHRMQNDVENMQNDVENMKPTATPILDEKCNGNSCPSYYQAEGYELMDVLDAFGLSFSSANAVKYIIRAGNKPGNSAFDDLRKARVCLDKAIAREDWVEMDKAIAREEMEAELNL